MLNEDLAVFFNLDEFAVVALYNHTQTVNGLLGKAYSEINGVETTAPSFTCAEAAVPAAAHGDDVEINAIAYKVVGIHPDGTGLVTLILEEQ